MFPATRHAAVLAYPTLVLVFLWLTSASHARHVSSVNVCVNAALYNCLPLVGHRVLGTAKQMKAVLTKKPGNNNLLLFFLSLCEQPWSDSVPLPAWARTAGRGERSRLPSWKGVQSVASVWLFPFFLFLLLQFFKLSCCHKKGRNGFVL